jgi:MFS-type transporter involved in bile tolerance (Atg22 family)
MADQGGLPELFYNMREQLALLAFSGVGGAFFRAVLAPEEQWKRRVVQGASGALSAIFLGGVLAHVINTVTGAGPLSYLAAGFLMGSGGELAVKAMQDRLMVKK